MRIYEMLLEKDAGWLARMDSEERKMLSGIMMSKDKQQKDEFLASLEKKYGQNTENKGKE